MRKRLMSLVLLCGGMALADGTRVLALAHLEQQQELQEFVNTVRMVGGLENVQADAAAHTVTVSGTADQLGLATWLLGELDRAQPPAAFTTADTTFSDPRSPAVRIVYPVHLPTPQMMQEM